MRIVRRLEYDLPRYMPNGQRRLKIIMFARTDEETTILQLMSGLLSNTFEDGGNMYVYQFSTVPSTLAGIPKAKKGDKAILVLIMPRRPT